MTEKDYSINAGDLTVPPAEQNRLPMVDEIRELPPVHQYVIDVDRMVRRTSETEVKIALMEVLDAVSAIKVNYEARDWRSATPKGPETIKAEAIEIIKRALK